MKRITIKEIAKKAGVSVGTVDRVLHDRGEVAEKTKKLVLKIAKEGNYSTNVFARNLKLNKTYKLAVLIPDDNEYWRTQKIGIERAAKEYEHLGIQALFYTFDRQNLGSFLENSDKAIKEEPDGVVMAPLMGKESPTVCARLTENDIPFVFVDSNISQANPLAFVGQDTFQSGYLSAKLLNYGSKKGLSTAIIIYSDYDSKNKTLRERINGYKKYYEDRDWDQALVTEYIVENKSFFSQEKLKGVEILFVPNSRAHQVCMDLGEGREANYRILGYDQIQPNVDCLKNGSIDFIINQNPQLQGYLSVQTLYKKLIVSSDVEELNLMPLEVVTKENLAYSNSSFY
ncbi:LacI family DNA-binding transcriptional regulator [Reichenbachiella versicolor]|uniref:LacI family DNA-binding transcriptional regulator n=1 Tax=Reichenbachiella versicolor TaxID=1821036 RepID=UPI000D6E1DDC|nr:LacI family DNA-binding transcriptional regulator [Reichenbachiella versicolor]